MLNVWRYVFIVKAIIDKKALVTFVSENLTFTGDGSSLSVLMLQVLGAFAQFQRMIIRKAQPEGIAIAKREGVYRGRKKKLTPEDVVTALQRISTGDSNAQIVRDLGAGRHCTNIGRRRRWSVVRRWN